MTMAPTSVPTDEQLMKQYQQGDPAGFDELYRRYSGRVYAYLRKRLDSREQVEEVFQAIFLKVHQSRSRFDPAYPISQWIFVVARTSLLDHYRKAGRQVPIEESAPFEELLSAQVSQNESNSALDEGSGIEILEDLPPEQRKAVEMRVMEEMSYEQIALKLNRSQESVRQLVSRALRRLRSVTR